MKIKNIFSLLLVLMAGLFLQSCHDDDNDAVAATGLSVTKDGAEINALSFSMGESYQMIGIATDGDWTVSVPDADTTWLHVTPHSGPGWDITDTTGTVTNTRSYVRVSVDKNAETPRQSVLTVVSGSFSKQVTVTQNGIATGGNDPIETVWDMVKNFKWGYNLGNTLDSNPVGDWWDPTVKTVKDWETGWGQPETTQEIIDGIHAMGANVIRIPVTWDPHMDANNQIAKEWMDRVEEVVNYALKNDMYVILNVQHDTGASGAWLVADEESYAQLTIKYQAIWKQVAERFKDYDQKLIFECFNEILNKQYSWQGPAAGDGAYKAINMLEQDFVNVVRATGGNNEYRNLAITTYAATANLGAGNGDPLAEVAAPQDVHPNHIYLSIHSYDPYNFCNKNAGKNADGTEYDYNINVFNADCTAAIDDIVKRCVDRAANLGMPFIFGEFGAIDEEKSMAERVKYATYVGQKLKANGTSGLWWMGLYDRKKLEVYEPLIVNALQNTMGM